MVFTDELIQFSFAVAKEVDDRTLTSYRRVNAILEDQVSGLFSKLMDKFSGRDDFLELLGPSGIDFIPAVDEQIVEPCSQCAVGEPDNR